MTVEIKERPPKCRRRCGGAKVRAAQAEAAGSFSKPDDLIRSLRGRRSPYRCAMGRRSVGVKNLTVVAFTPSREPMAESPRFTLGEARVTHGFQR